MILNLFLTKIINIDFIILSLSNYQQQKFYKMIKYKQSTVNWKLIYQEYLQKPYMLKDLKNIGKHNPMFQMQDYHKPVNNQENFTFCSNHQSIKILKNLDNHNRILYYTILHYIFQICSCDQRQTIISSFTHTILHSTGIILPYKAKQSKNIIKNQSIITNQILTTNQIKSSLVKFFQVLQKKCQKFIRKNNIVLQELCDFIQIDMVFMSLMYLINKNQQQYDQSVIRNIYKIFAIKLQLINDGFVIDQRLIVEKSPSQIYQNYDIYIVKQIKSSKNSNFFKLKNKQTTQSIGQIQSTISSYKNIEDVNKNFRYAQLINAKFVQSYNYQQQNVNIQSLGNYSFAKQTLQEVNINFITPFVKIKQNANGLIQNANKAQNQTNEDMKKELINGGMENKLVQNRSVRKLQTKEKKKTFFKDQNHYKNTKEQFQLQMKSRRRLTSGNQRKRFIDKHLNPKTSIIQPLNSMFRPWTLSITRSNNAQNRSQSSGKISTQKSYKKFFSKQGLDKSSNIKAQFFSSLHLPKYPSNNNVKNEVTQRWKNTQYKQKIQKSQNFSFILQDKPTQTIRT